MENLKYLLDSEVERHNVKSFIDDDPVQFPRRFSDNKDIEAVSLLVSTIAWGRRPMILKSAEKMLSMMDHDPYNYIMSGEWATLPDANIHRTFFTQNFKHYLRGLRRIFERYGSLEGLAASLRPSSGKWVGASWEIAAAVNRELCAANDGAEDCRCLPIKLDKSALKKFNMALRWLVRKDGIVDIGIWDALRPSELYIPLDVHVGNISRQLGLVERTANDRCTVEDLTARLAELRPDDPVIYDFALFGVGVSGATKD